MKDGLMVKYQFEIDDETWDEWKNTVPRSKSLETRITELIEADAEGRVQPSGQDDIAESNSSEESEEEAEEDEELSYDTFETDSDAYPDAEAVRGATVSRDVIDEETEERIREGLFGSGNLLDARVNEILKMYMELQRQGEATKEELLSVVDVEAADYQDKGSVWSNMVKGKDTLKAIPGVQKPPRGKSKWTYTGESE
jgi:hypothetical protein